MTSEINTKKKPDAVWIQRLLIDMLGLTKYPKKSRNGYIEQHFRFPQWQFVKPSLGK